MISSLQNPKVKDVLRLRKRRRRDEQNKVLIEGEREVARAYAQGVTVHQLYVCPELTSPSGKEWVKSLEGGAAEVIPCSRSVFEKISYRDGPDGVLAVVTPRMWALDEVPLSACPLVLAVERIEKPGNLGALLRHADAVGADAVLVCDPVTDVYNPNVIRASTGTLFSRPVIQVSSTEAIHWLKKHGIQIAAAIPETGRLYTEANLAGPTAVLLGAEHEGVSPEWRQAADIHLTIPMRGQADSLNVSAAGVLLLYEAIRQRA